MEVKQFIQEHISDNIQSLALMRNRYPQLTDADFSFALRQIEGRQRTKDKLSFLHNYPDWQFPQRLSLEQCSSEETAKYKAGLVAGRRLIDLTGGMGIDTLFLSEKFKETHYVERQDELCQIAKHNFELLNWHIQVHCCDAETFLQEMEPADVIYIDPARRNKAGRKVFRLEDCEPNLIELLPQLRQKCSTLLLKLSPMFDLTQAVRALPAVKQAHVVALKGETKEILIYIDFTASNIEIPVHCVNLNTDDQEFVFTLDKEKTADCTPATSARAYIYEPNPAIMKAGAYKTIAAEYDILKLDNNTHLYTSDTLISDFPGRIFRLINHADKKQLKGTTLNVISRNYPLSAEQLQNKHSIHDGSNNYLIATRIAGNNSLLLAERIR